MNSKPHLIPSKDNGYLYDHIQLLRTSYHTLIGRDFVDHKMNEVEAAKELFHSPFIVLSHDTRSDPVLNYINKAGLELFEMDWDRMLTTPSRLTAQSMEQEARMQLLDKVTANGFIDDYSGVRDSSSGRRFLIEKATVWNLVDQSGVYQGQAAMFSDWSYFD
jgi:hypothetical protein